MIFVNLFVFSLFMMLLVVYVQIHLRQFHGTRYAAISPDMVSTEELEVQESHLSSNQEDDQWDVYPTAVSSEYFQEFLCLISKVVLQIFLAISDSTEYIFIWQMKQYFGNDLYINDTQPLCFKKTPCLMWNDWYMLHSAWTVHVRV